jgi:hypothetical protein
MILDSLASASKYAALHPLFAKHLITSIVLILLLWKWANLILMEITCVGSFQIKME